MNIDWVIPARHAEIHDNLATIVGGGIDRQAVAELPAVVGLMLAIRLTATSEEIGPDQMHSWRNIVKNPAGEAIAEGGGEFAIGAENPRTDWLNNFLISAAIQFEAEDEGTYTIELIVDEAISALPIHVVYEPLEEIEVDDEDEDDEELA
jgi:hypothetical protein